MPPPVLLPIHCFCRQLSMASTSGPPLAQVFPMAAADASCLPSTACLPACPYTTPAATSRRQRPPGVDRLLSAGKAGTPPSHHPQQHQQQQHQQGGRYQTGGGNGSQRWQQQQSRFGQQAGRGGGRVVEIDNSLDYPRGGFARGPR